MQARPWYLISVLGFLDDNNKLVVFVDSHNKQVLFAAFAGSPISIILSHDEFELNTVPSSGPGS